MQASLCLAGLTTGSTACRRLVRLCLDGHRSRLCDSSSSPLAHGGRRGRVLGLLATSLDCESKPKLATSSDVGNVD